MKVIPGLRKASIANFLRLREAGGNYQAVGEVVGVGQDIGRGEKRRQRGGVLQQKAGTDGDEDGPQKNQRRGNHAEPEDTQRFITRAVKDRLPARNMIPARKVPRAA
jgi:hypothetical protein